MSTDHDWFIIERQCSLIEAKGNTLLVHALVYLAGYGASLAWFVTSKDEVWLFVAAVLCVYTAWQLSAALIRLRRLNNSIRTLLATQPRP